MRFQLAVAALVALAGCAAPPATEDLSGVDALLIGEQHDASAHPGEHERWVASLARRGALAGVALEMAERGTSTSGLPAGASDEQVRQALRWNAEGWPWPRYGPAIMAAVRAGVPVVGANLPRGEMRQAMQDTALDQLLPGPALKAQQQAVRLGHCELLPETQIRPMTRIQIARDREMARTLSTMLAPGKTVVLLAGAGHVQPDLGVPQHLPATVRVRALPLPREETGKDYCGELRKQMAPKAS